MLNKCNRCGKMPEIKAVVTNENKMMYFADCCLSTHAVFSAVIELGQYWNQYNPLRTNAVDHPEHYKSNGIEAIDVIEAFNLNFCVGNAIKYILRAGRKSEDPTEDLNKAVWCLKRQIKCKNRGSDNHE